MQQPSSQRFVGHCLQCFIFVKSSVFQFAQHEERPENSTAKRLLRCFAGLDSEGILQICADASALQSPLLLAMASEKARRLVTEQEQASWRHNVSGEHTIFFNLVMLFCVAMADSSRYLVESSGLISLAAV